MTRQRRPVSSALKWLVLVALAWSQLAFAAHQFDHHVNDSGESCAVCVKFERDDAATIDAGGQTPTAPATSIGADVGTAAVVAGPRTHYAARASP